MLMTGLPMAGWNLSMSFSSARMPLAALAMALMPVARAAAVCEARPMEDDIHAEDAALGVAHLEVALLADEAVVGLGQASGRDFVRGRGLCRSGRSVPRRRRRAPGGGP